MGGQINDGGSGQKIAGDGERVEGKWAVGGVEKRVDID